MREHRDALADVVEPLPGRMRARERLTDRAAALTAEHFPRDAREAEGARRRLAFEELLLHQLTVLRRKARRSGGVGAEPLDEPPTLTERWLARVAAVHA